MPFEIVTDMPAPPPAIPRKGTPTYQAWVSMRNRCHNKNTTEYPRYGGRGISTHPDWDDFEVFYAAVGERPEGLTLERIDNNKNYEPGNVCWATRKEQTRNREISVTITYKSETKTLAEWSEITGIAYHTLKARIRRLGYSPEEALNKPVKSGAKLEGRVYKERAKQNSENVPRGFKHYNSKLSEAEVRAAQAEFDSTGASYSDIARKYNLSVETASKLCQREGHYNLGAHSAKET